MTCIQLLRILFYVFLGSPGAVLISSQQFFCDPILPILSAVMCSVVVCYAECGFAVCYSNILAIQSSIVFDSKIFKRELIVIDGLRYTVYMLLKNNYVGLRRIYAEVPSDTTFSIVYMCTHNIIYVKILRSHEIFGPLNYNLTMQSTVITTVKTLECIWACVFQRFTYRF